MGFISFKGSYVDPRIIQLKSVKTATIVDCSFKTRLWISETGSVSWEMMNAQQYSCNSSATSCILLVTSDNNSTKLTLSTNIVAINNSPCHLLFWSLYSVLFNNILFEASV